MIVLQIEHPVPSFDAWRQAFDGDPIGRERSGVRRYRIMRPVDDPNYAIVDLEFESRGDAEGCLAALQSLWRQVEGTVMEGPRARIVEMVESKDY